MLPLTELDDAYAVQETSPGARAAPEQSNLEIPELPDHGKRTRPVSIRDAMPVKRAQRRGHKEDYTDAQDAPTAADRASAKRRRDMLGVFVMVLVVAAGLALHAALNEAVSAYVQASFMTPWGDTTTRLAYPACLVAAIWCVKGVQGSGRA
jgi:hypothetical protein